jgi:hypothetical protein
MALPERKLSPAEVAPPLSRKSGSARRDAERAISEFQSKMSELSNDEARDAYAHLVIGRGFRRLRERSPPRPRLLKRRKIRREAHGTREFRDVRLFPIQTLNPLKDEK